MTVEKIRIGRVVNRPVIRTYRRDCETVVQPYQPAVEDVAAIANGTIAHFIAEAGNPELAPVPGDRLWIREPWQICRVNRFTVEVGYAAHQTAPLCEFLEIIPREHAVANPRKYRQSYHYGPLAPSFGGARWMPRWASRLFLEITRVEENDEGQQVVHFTAYRGNIARPETAMRIGVSQ